VNGSNSGLGAGGNTEFDTGEQITFDFDAAQTSISIGINTTADFDITVEYLDENGDVLASEVWSVDVRGNSDESGTFSNGGQEFYAVRITRTDSDNGSVKVTSVGYQSPAPTETYTLDIHLEDADGDQSASASLSVEVAFGNNPIAIDLGGEGVEYLSTDAGVVFTDQTTGESVNSAWVGPEDGMLVIDANNSGTVDESREYVFTEWSDTAQTDMEAVAEVFDTNKDGVLDAQDEQWDQFAVWQDADSDGVTDEGELVSLSELGVESIALTYNDDSESGTAADGDVIVHGQSTVTFTDGSTTIAEDVTFAISAGDVLSDDDSVDIPAAGEGGQAGAPAESASPESAADRSSYEADMLEADLMTSGNSTEKLDTPEQ